ncbi:MAG: DUF115 domain-containing protein [Deltaproteobacteria bacterium]
MLKLIEKFNNNIQLLKKGEYDTVWKKITGLFRKIRVALTRNYFSASKWKSIKNKYPGQRAFLIGNGPSLNKTPLYLLANEYTMCFNRFNLMFERLSWLPTMYSTTDERVAMDIADEINSFVPRIQYAFFPDKDPNIGHNIKKIIKNRENIFWLFLTGRKFSSKLPRAAVHGTVALAGLQILAYMGFREIYLIGVDMDYTTPKNIIKENDRDWTSQADDDPNHFDPRYFGKDRKYHKPRIDDIVAPGYAAAKKYFDAAGVKIINATVGGKLEIFPRVEFNCLFSYTMEEELHLLLGERYKPGSQSLMENFPDAKILRDAKDWDDSYHQVIVNGEEGLKLIPNVILTHLPLGPFHNQYIFLKREVG